MINKNISFSDFVDGLINQKNKTENNINFSENITSSEPDTSKVSWYVECFSVGKPKWVGKYKINFDDQELVEQYQTQPAPEKTIPEEMNDKKEDVEIDTSKSQWYLEIPKAITAIQWIGNNYQSMEDFCNNGRYRVSDLGDGTLKLTDSEGSVIINPGDYVASLKSGLSVYNSHEFIKNYQYVQKDSDAEKTNPAMQEGESNEGTDPNVVDGINVDDIPGEDNVPEQFSKAIGKVISKLASKGAKGAKNLVKGDSLKKAGGSVKNAFNKVKDSKAGEFVKEQGTQALVSAIQNPNKAMETVGDLADSWNTMKAKLKGTYKPPVDDDDEEFFSNNGRLSNIIDSVKNKGLLKTATDAYKGKTYAVDEDNFSVVDKAKNLLSGKSANNWYKKNKNTALGGALIDNVKNTLDKEVNSKKVGEGIGGVLASGFNKLTGRSFSNIDSVVIHILDKEICKGNNPFNLNTKLGINVLDGLDNNINSFLRSVPGADSTMEGGQTNISFDKEIE